MLHSRKRFNFDYKSVLSLNLSTNSPMFNLIDEDMDINCGEILDGTINIQKLGLIIY